jgi:Na+/glutamate symporter
MLNVGCLSPFMFPVLEGTGYSMSQAVALAVLTGAIGLVSGLVLGYFQHRLAVKRMREERQEELQRETVKKLSLPQAVTVSSALRLAKWIASLKEPARPQAAPSSQTHRELHESSLLPILVMVLALAAALCLYSSFIDWFRRVLLG